MKTERDEFYDQARAELLAEAEQDLHRRTAERAGKLRGEAQRSTNVTALPTDPAELRTLLDQKRALLAHIDDRAKREVLSADEDRSRDRLRQQIYEIEKRCERAGILQPSGSAYTWPAGISA